MISCAVSELASVHCLGWDLQRAEVLAVVIEFHRLKFSMVEIQPWFSEMWNQLRELSYTGFTKFVGTNEGFTLLLHYRAHDVQYSARCPEAAVLQSLADKLREILQPAEEFWRVAVPTLESL